MRTRNPGRNDQDFLYYKGKNSFLFHQTACFRYSFNLTAHANEFYQCKFFCEIHVL